MLDDTMISLQQQLLSELVLWLPQEHTEQNDELQNIFISADIGKRLSVYLFGNLTFSYFFSYNTDW